MFINDEFLCVVEVTGDQRVCCIWMKCISYSSQITAHTTRQDMCNVHNRDHKKLNGGIEDFIYILCDCRSLNIF